MFKRTSDSADIPDGCLADCAEGIGAALIAVVVVLLVVFIGIPLLVALVEFLFLVLLAVAGAVGRVLFRRPWTVDAVSADGVHHVWRVVGWRAGAAALQRAPSPGTACGMTDDRLQVLVDELAALPVGSFVEALHRVFDARIGDVVLEPFHRSYVLAVRSLLSVDGDPSFDEVQVEFVARPLGSPSFDDLSQGGGCRRCGYEAVSTNKLARCGVCGADVGLT